MWLRKQVSQLRNAIIIVTVNSVDDPASLVPFLKALAFFNLLFFLICLIAFFFLVFHANTGLFLHILFHVRHGFTNSLLCRVTRQT